VDRNVVAVGLALTLVAACGPQSPRTDIGISVPGTTVDVDALIRAALLLDVASNRAADTLYAPEAVVVANARQRFAHPRFAGVSYGGRITLGSSAVTVEGRWAWAVVDYRWIGSAPNQIEAGRATFVCVRRGQGWRILHLHSSQLLPWDR
jgi:hypothetical protein